MSGFEDVNYYLRKAARVMDLSAAVGRILVTPYREVKVDAPTTPKADEALAQRGVTVLPDICVKAGGVTVSYFEWAQNIQQFTWEEDKVNAELHRHMRDAYATLARVVRERKVSFRTAAFIVAIGRVGRATVLRGV